ncbi:MAG TPA: sigma-70 family RNA polymerase sigma factor [Clostridiaceae bacterium]
MDFVEKVNLAKKGDDNAFYELINDRKAILYKMAYAYVKNKEDAVDIVSDTIYKSYISIRKLTEPSFFNSYVTRILINTSLDFIRKNKAMISLEDKDYPLLGILGKVEEGDKEAVLDLYKAVDKLDEKCKTTVILKYFQDMTIVQVAEIMELPIGTVKTYLHKALKELRLDLSLEANI